MSIICLKIFSSKIFNIFKKVWGWYIFRCPEKPQFPNGWISWVFTLLFIYLSEILESC